MGRLRRYLRLLSPMEIGRLLLAERLSRWMRSPAMRRALALREWTWLVPADAVARTGDLLRFGHPVAGMERRFALRRGTSDVEVFLGVIRDEEYREAARLVPASGRPPRIVDAGANVGLTTLYFSSLFPGARILALEPEPANHEALRRLVEENGLSEVRALRQALWTETTLLEPDWSFRGGQTWSFAVRPAAAAGEGAIPATTLAALLDAEGWDRVDLLKIDVEGAEAVLLRDPATLAVIRDRVDALCVEVHQERISRAEVERSLAGAGLRAVTARETLLAWRPGALGDPAQPPR